MKAAVGDRMVVASGTNDRPVRDGEVIEVRGPGGTPPYVVRWADNGHESIFWPGPDSHVSHPADESATATVPDADQPPHVKTWRVDVQLYQQGGSTTAHAVLHGDAPTAIAADGEARRRPGDYDVPEIGDEVAVARALRRLAERLHDVAANDIEAIAGEPVRLAP